MKKNIWKDNVWKVISLILFGLLIVMSISLGYSKINSSEDVYKIILKADADLMEISVDKQIAESYYTEASYAYEDEDYKKVESNCRLARSYYAESSQEYKRIKAELRDKDSNDKLIVLYI